MKFQDTAEHEVLVSREDTEHMLSSSASIAKPIGYNALNFLKSQVGKIQELTLSNFIESVHRWYKSDENNISDKESVSNLDILMTGTNIFSNQDALALKHLPLLSNDSATDLVSTNPTFNINGTLILANLVVRIMHPVTQKMTANDTTSNTNEITVYNNVVDSDHVHRLAYSSYAPVIGDNAEYTE